MILVVAGSSRSRGSSSLAYGWFEAGWLRNAGARGARSRACRRRSTACGSRISPTSTSACPRAGASRPSARSPGSASGGPTSSASPATSSRIRAACRCCVRLLAPLERPVRRPREPRRRDHARSVLARGGARRPRGGGRAAPRRGGRSSSYAACRVQVVGVDAESVPRRTRAPVGARRPGRRPPDPPLPLPRASRGKLPPGAFDLVLAGHLHAGQICIPYPGGRLHARPSARRARRRGLYRRRGRRDARLAGHRDDVRPVPLLRPARGDRARAPPRAASASTLGGACNNPLMEGHSVISTDVARRAMRPTRRSRSTGVRGSSRARCRGTTASGSSRRTAASRSSSTSPSSGARPRRRSGPRSSSASPSTSGGWPTSTRRPWTSSSTRSAPPPEGG